MSNEIVFAVLVQGLPNVHILYNYISIVRRPIYFSLDVTAEHSSRLTDCFMSLASFWLLSMLSKNNLHKVLIMFELLPGRLEVSNKIENKIKIE